MAYPDGIVTPYWNSTSPTQSARTRRSSCQKEEKSVDERDIVQGQILWLPPKEELPERAVRRAHGKGAVEEGIYNHPVVILSRPKDDSNVVHFHVITSFQGKKLNEIYGKANEFHASRRSWYLPITPTPPHPDASSKKAKKRFPNLELAGGALLRWDSYVNLRDVYSIEWSCLRAYGNPNTPYNLDYRLDRESMIRMLAKTKILTTYEVGSQFQVPVAPTPQVPTLSPRPTFPQYPPAGGYYNPAPTVQPTTPGQTTVSFPYPQQQQQPFLGQRPNTATPGSIREPPQRPPDETGERNAPDEQGKCEAPNFVCRGWLWSVLKALYKWIWGRASRKE